MSKAVTLVLVGIGMGLGIALAQQRVDVEVGTWPSGGGGITTSVVQTAADTRIVVAARDRNGINSVVMSSSREHLVKLRNLIDHTLAAYDRAAGGAR